jgi:hypothetical protein
MADLPKYKPDGVTQVRVTRLTGWFIVTGAAISAQAGTSTSTSGGQLCGVTWSYSSTGDYRATLHRGYKRLLRTDASLVVPGALGTAIGTAIAAIVGVTTSAYFTGATPVPAAGALGIVTQAVAGARLEVASGTVVTYDFEFSDV